jgi:hypothetical protein
VNGAVELNLITPQHLILCHVSSGAYSQVESIIHINDHEIKKVRRLRREIVSQLDEDEEKIE